MASAAVPRLAPDSHKRKPLRLVHVGAEKCGELAGECRRGIVSGAAGAVTQPPAPVSACARQVLDADLNEGSLVLSALICAR